MRSAWSRNSISTIGNRTCSRPEPIAAAMTNKHAFLLGKCARATLNRKSNGPRIFTN
jgi:hypothetical protein